MQMPLDRQIIALSDEAYCSLQHLTWRHPMPLYTEGERDHRYRCIMKALGALEDMLNHEARFKEFLKNLTPEERFVAPVYGPDHRVVDGIADGILMAQLYLRQHINAFDRIAKLRIQRGVISAEDLAEIKTALPFILRSLDLYWRNWRGYLIWIDQCEAAE